MCVRFHSSHALTPIRPTNTDSHKDGVLIWNLGLKWKNTENMRNIWPRSISRKRRFLVLAQGHVWRKKGLEKQIDEREGKLTYCRPSWLDMCPQCKTLRLCYTEDLWDWRRLLLQIQKKSFKKWHSKSWDNSSVPKPNKRPMKAAFLRPHSRSWCKVTCVTIFLCTMLILFNITIVSNKDYVMLASNIKAFVLQVKCRGFVQIINTNNFS